MKFTINQLALLGAVFFNDVDNLKSYQSVAQALQLLHDLGDPYDADLAYEFITQANNPNEPIIAGKLKEKDTLKYFVAKVVFWLQK